MSTRILSVRGEGSLCVIYYDMESFMCRATRVYLFEIWLPFWICNFVEKGLEGRVENESETTQTNFPPLSRPALSGVAARPHPHALLFGCSKKYFFSCNFGD